MGVLGGIPFQVGYGVTGFTPTAASPFDVKIGDLEFMLAIGPENPFIRRGAEYRTQQVNFSAEPGETALGFWWQREQSTWHNGTANPTFDGPGSGDAAIAVGRFADSYGVDVWTPDQISLLHDGVIIEAGTSIVGPVIGMQPSNPNSGIQYVYWADGDEVHQWDNVGGSITATGAWGDVLSVASDGVNLYFTDGVNVMAFKVGGFTVLYSSGFDGAATRYLLRWAKQRLIFAEDNRLYELNQNASAAALPTEFFEHPNPAWIWTDVVEGPGAIYAAGGVGTSSAVYKFVLDTTDGSLPTLTAGIVACELPEGERVLCLKTYIGLFIGMGTSAGLRVCSFADTDIVLAPLTIENVGPVRAITTWDRFFYVTCDDAGEGQAGTARVDLSVETAAGRYAWAKDVRANTDTTGDTHTGLTGEVTGIAMYSFGDNPDATPVFAITANGLYARHFDRLTQYGSLISGRMLFGMTDPKHFLRVALKGTGSGTATIYTGVDSADAVLPQTTIDLSQLNEVDLLTTDLRGGTLTIGIGLTRDATDDEAGPVVQSYSAKALPAQPRERQYIMPLRVYDRVEMGSGETGYQVAADVLDALEELVRTQQPVLLQTFFGDPERDWISKLVHIEDFEYRQVTGEPDQAWGGITTLSCRTISG